MRWFRFSRLQNRLTVFVLAVVIPPIMAVLLLVSAQAEQLLEKNADERLQSNSEALANTISGWMDMNLRALKQLVSLPSIVNDDASTQKPVLKAMADAYPHMYLVSTTDLNGINVARNDDAAPKDYHDRAWYQGAASGAPLTFQTLIGRTSGEPALVASMPIRDKNSTIVGVGMFATDLTVIADQVNVTRLGETGFAYLVNDQGQVLAHPDPSFTAELVDLSAYPPASQALSGYSGPFEFSDEQNRHWLAYVQALDHGWGLVVQQETSEVLGSLHSFQRLTWRALAGITIAVMTLVWLMTRRALRLVGPITDAAMAVAQGDLNQSVPVGSSDELGILARSFNTMTTQLRDLIVGLETRVAERTADLANQREELEQAHRRQVEINRQLEDAIRQSQRRARLLQASAEVSRAVAQIRELDVLLPEVTRLISHHFGFYHVGIFLIDEAHRYAVLRAANSAGGQRMLARQHKLAVGSQGMVGYVTGTEQPRIALDVGADAVYFDNPDLPDTRSEVALPLRIGDLIIGALDVQSVEEAAFDDEDVTVLTALADQIAIAIESARLFQQSERALEDAQLAHKRYLRQQWSQLTHDQSTLAYEHQLLGVPSGNATLLPVAEQALREGRLVIASDDDLQNRRTARDNGDQVRAAMAVPIKVRGETIGVIEFQETDDDHVWTDDEITMVQTIVDQLGQALEEARLFQQTQVSLAETQTLFQTSRNLAAAQQVEEIWEAIVDAARQRGVDACGLFLFDTHERQSANELVLVTGWDQHRHPPRLPIGTKLPLSLFSMFDNLRQDQSFVINDEARATNIDPGLRALLNRLGFSALLYQPISVRGHWFGLLAVLYQSPHAYTNAETDFFRSLADQAALAFEGQRLLAEAQRRAEREQLIREVTDKVRATADLETILQTTVQELSKATGFPRAFIRLGTEDITAGAQQIARTSSHDHGD